MLKKVEIKNFALIESAIFEPGKHLTVISGETGAGKSLLIDALGSLTGKRANREVVRTGFDYARVEAIFSLNTELQNLRLFQDLDADEHLILSREIFADGGSQARINGRLVNNSLLREVSDHLIGLHAQHEQQQIFDLNEQRNLLDKYIGNSIADLLIEWQTLLKSRKKLAEQLREYGLNPAERARQLELLQYQIAEITDADLKIDEDKILLERNKILATLSRIKQDLIQARNILSADSEHGAASMIAQAASILDYSSRFSEKTALYQKRLKQLASDVSEQAINLTDVYQELEAEPNEIEMINQRLDQIDKLKIKYGDTIKEILQYSADAEKRLNVLKKSEELFTQCRADLLSNEQEMAELAEKIHSLRFEAGQELSEQISFALAKLAMPNVKFSVKVKLLEKSEKGYYGLYGRDQVEYFIQPNIGEPLMPLNKIASGGEVSRILLAIKSILGENDELSVLIFDEIDSGVSGNTALSVAQMLREIADNKQVLCVSHMAQVAAASDTHFLIEKTVQDQRTSTQLKKLDLSEKTREVARLLSGNPHDQSTINLAKQMISQYKQR
ncbi:MAG: DNA repair protein RecN [Clostridiaceae bacterium]|nr:DNA repair protein RecN [Clostridiaceae bacterium]